MADELTHHLLLISRQPARDLAVAHDPVLVEDACDSASHKVVSFDKPTVVGIDY